MNYDYIQKNPQYANPYYSSMGSTEELGMMEPPRKMFKISENTRKNMY